MIAQNGLKNYEELRCRGSNEKCPLGLRYLNTWSPKGGTVWGGYGTIRGWSRAGRSTSLRVGFEGL